ncbi:pyruvate kinase [Pasteurella sp. PK-2025]|uniref:pyruvate kinase n=1 Tax=Pasteurella sp. PK-2025 TaxID=3413133 RepID=UPI003C7850E5
MKEFDLEKALAGEPVVLRNGNKAFVKFVLENPLLEDDQVAGFHIDKEGKEEVTSWSKNGIHIPNINGMYDIIGMWEEPRQRVHLDLPAPLKEPQEGMWLINKYGLNIEKSSYSQRFNDGLSEECLLEGRYFATKEDAQAWLDAMRESRR